MPEIEGGRLFIKILVKPNGLNDPQDVVFPILFKVLSLAFTSDDHKVRCYFYFFLQTPCLTKFLLSSFNSKCSQPVKLKFL